MRKIKCNIYYGSKDIVEIIEEIIEEKIIKITKDIKRGKIASYNNNKANENLSTNCEKKQEVVKK